MSKVQINNDHLYNITRSHKGERTIFKEQIRGKEAKTWLAHLKRMARHSGGKVYFDIIPVPEHTETTPIQHS
jgi:hypothetical protein